MDKLDLKIDRLYYTMKNKCSNPKHPKYSIYGERGIKVCDEWTNDKSSFFNWCYKNGVQENLTLDRIDVNGDYCPENCRWATNKQQQRNKRKTLYLIINGEKKVLSELCEKYKSNYMVTKNRYNVFKKYNVQIDCTNIDLLFKPVGFFYGRDLVKLITKEQSDFEKLILKKRLEKRETLEDLAINLHFNYENLIAVLKGKRQLSINLAKKIINHFCMNEDEIKILTNTINDCHKRYKIGTDYLKNRLQGLKENENETDSDR